MTDDILFIKSNDLVPFDLVPFDSGPSIALAAVHLTEAGEMTDDILFIKRGDLVPFDSWTSYCLGNRTPSEPLQLYTENACGAYLGLPM